MRRRGYAVNIASIAGKEGNPNASAYSASNNQMESICEGRGKVARLSLQIADTRPG